MNLHQKHLGFAFALSLLATLLLNMRLLFFAPFLVITYYKKPLSTCLWFSLICGTIIDLLSSETRLGFHAFNYCIVTSILYSQKRSFFADSLSTLPMMTYLFSLISTSFQMGLWLLFQRQVLFSWEWLATDLILMPAFDSAYSFVVFVLPFLLLGKRPRKGKDYFLRTD